jgi:hypothetical protein
MKHCIIKTGREEFFAKIENKSFIVFLKSFTGKNILRSEPAACRPWCCFNKNNCWSLIVHSLSKYLFSPSISATIVYVDDNKVSLVWWEITNDFCILRAIYYLRQSVQIGEGYWLVVGNVDKNFLDNWIIKVFNLLDRFWLKLQDLLKLLNLQNFFVQPTLDRSSLLRHIIDSLNSYLIFNLGPCVCI